MDQAAADRSCHGHLEPGRQLCSPTDSAPSSAWGIENGGAGCTELCDLQSWRHAEHRAQAYVSAWAATQGIQTQGLCKRPQGPSTSAREAGTEAQSFEIIGQYFEGKRMMSNLEIEERLPG